MNVQLPKRGDNLSDTSDEIVIIGYEEQAQKARDEILAIVNDLVSQFYMWCMGVKMLCAEGWNFFNSFWYKFVL